MRRARNIVAVLQGGLLMAKVANEPDRFVDAIPLIEAAVRAEDLPAGVGRARI